MVSVFKKGFTPSTRYVSVIFLAFLWCASLIFGWIVGSKIDFNFSLMPGCFPDTLSIVIILLIRIFPLVWLIIAISFNASLIIYLSASIRGFSYGYLFSAFNYLFSSAGWLLIVFQFWSALCLNVLLIFIWINALSLKTDLLKPSALLYCIVIVIFTICEQILLNPMLDKLITYY